MRSTLLAVAMIVTLSHQSGAQAAREVQAHGVAVVTGPEFFGGGLGIAFRPAGRMRIGVDGSAGTASGDVGGRSSLVVTYHLNPYRRRGVTPYAGGGVSLRFGPTTSEYLVVVFGMEANPGAMRGWFAEAGLSGGLFLSAGVRVRWRSTPGS